MVYGIVLDVFCPPSPKPSPQGEGFHAPRGLKNIRGRIGWADLSQNRKRASKNPLLGGRIPRNKTSRIDPLNHPAQAIIKTQGAFPPLRVGGADGERAGVRCASHNLGVHGKDTGEGERQNILSITDAVTSLANLNTRAPPYKTISRISCISWLTCW